MKVDLIKKLITSVILMLVSVSLMVSVTYAWLTLSTAPQIAGIRLTIGGDNTILIADDIKELTDDNKVVSYPGYFSKNATLTTPEDALLSPVSTADGVNWFIPSISEDGQMVVEDLSDFTLDSELRYANSSEGGYVYVDFWVMSPLDNCVLRVCTGQEEVGSYAIELPEAKKNFTNKTGYNLEENSDTLAASVRVGFLVNEDPIATNEEMSSYMNSSGYRNEIKSLKGVYEAENEKKFLIYEPNGLIHPNEGHSVQLGAHGLESVVCENGEYWITNPIGLNDLNEPILADVSTRLIVQTQSEWKKDAYGEELIEQMYQEYLRNSEEDVTLDDFYTSESYLNNSYLQYVTAGNLFKYTSDLYHSGSQKVSEEELSILEQSNVVVDSYVTILNKNVPQKIRMFVWMEGQDVDCNYKAAGQTISIRLELAGSTGA